MMEPSPHMEAAAQRQRAEEAERNASVLQDELQRALESLDQAWDEVMRLRSTDSVDEFLRWLADQPVNLDGGSGPMDIELDDEDHRAWLIEQWRTDQEGDQR